MLVPQILLGGRRAVCDLAKSIDDDADLEKSLGGPFVGPNGGMWADAQHTIHWQPNDPHGAASLLHHHPTLSTARAHKKYQDAGGTLPLSTWQHHHIRAKKAAALAAQAASAAQQPAPATAAPIVPQPATTSAALAVGHILTAATAATAAIGTVVESSYGEHFTKIGLDHWEEESMPGSHYQDDVLSGSEVVYLPASAPAAAQQATPAVAAQQATPAPQHILVRVGPGATATVNPALYAPTHDDPHAVKRILAAYPNIGATAAHKIYAAAGGTLAHTTWQHKYIAHKAALSAGASPAATTAPTTPAQTAPAAAAAPQHAVGTKLTAANIASVPVGTVAKVGELLAMKVAGGKWVTPTGVVMPPVDLHGAKVHIEPGGPAYMVDLLMDDTSLGRLAPGAKVKGTNTGTIYTKQPNGTWTKPDGSSSTMQLASYTRFISGTLSPFKEVAQPEPIKFTPAPAGTAAHKLAALVGSHAAWKPGATMSAADKVKTIKIGGKVLTGADVPRLLGLVPGVDAQVSEYGTSFSVYAKGNGVTQNRDIHAGPPPYIYNSYFRLPAGSPHHGTDVLAQQAVAASQAGFSYLKCNAHRGSGFNGYYTWARLGYVPIGDPAGPIHNAIVVGGQAAKTAADAAGITTTTPLVDVMKTQAGRDWWKAHGRSWDAKFDLSPDSHSMKTLAAYVAAKKGVTKSIAKAVPVDENDGGEQHEEIDLTDEDHAILDRVWDEMGADLRKSPVAPCIMLAGLVLSDLHKSLPHGGPFIGPNGGKWADAKHTIHWAENDPHGAKALALHHGHLSTAKAHKLYQEAGGAAPLSTWQHKHIAAKKAIAAGTLTAHGAPSPTAAPSGPPAPVAAPAAASGQTADLDALYAKHGSAPGGAAKAHKEHLAAGGTIGVAMAAKGQHGQGAFYHAWQKAKAKAAGQTVSTVAVPPMVAPGAASMGPIGPIIAQIAATAQTPVSSAVTDKAHAASLPAGSVVVDSDGEHFTKKPDGGWYGDFTTSSYGNGGVVGFTVLTPDAAKKHKYVKVAHSILTAPTVPDADTVALINSELGKVGASLNDVAAYAAKLKANSPVPAVQAPAVQAPQPVAPAPASVSTVAVAPTTPVATTSPPVAPALTEADIMHVQTGPQGGSNPGGKFMGKDGVQRYVKHYKDPTQAHGEVLANSIYRGLGHAAPAAIAFQRDNGKTSFASEIMPAHKGELGKQGGITQAHARKALDGFAADVLTANWDAAGLDHDNMVVQQDGSIARIDNGSAFLHRAQGTRKADHLLNNPTELAGFFDAGTNGSYAKLAKIAGYAKASDIPDLKAQVGKIVAMRDASGGWDAYVTQNAPGLAGADRSKVVSMLDARTKALQDAAK